MNGRVDESGLLKTRRLPLGAVHIDVGLVLLDSGAGVFSDNVPRGGSPCSSLPSA